ncbi:sulfite dehydrogenase, partial [Mesorhizobium sp. M6A.T.Cr.TU.014.01.1.1]
MSGADSSVPGRLVKAPEGHLDAAQLAAARVARRSFMGKALAIGAGATAGAGAARAADDPAIVELPAHTRGLGQG